MSLHRLIFFFFTPFILEAQSFSTLKNFNYKKADSIALSLSKKEYKTVPEIATALTEKLTTQHEKFRAIFRWITHNIEYNKSAQNTADAYKVVRKNKAVCQGFSNLLKEMCNLQNIACEVITGYTKTEVSDINKKLKKTDHAWNCVQLYGAWYLVDVTWATSKYNVVAKKFIKEFDEHYFLTPPEKFILDHFPQDKKYQFLDKPMKKSVFVKMPVYYPDYFHYNIQSVSPDKGFFSWRAKDSLAFFITTNYKLTEAAILLNDEKYISPTPLLFDEQKQSYYIKVFFNQIKPTDLTLYLNGNCITEYLINLKK
ncbi:MAG: hypothetical protein JST67_05900 [Bacteroidetes bacterium]|nr:hypothetical protein [Bacteroidota bacterium]